MKLNNFQFVVRIMVLCFFSIPAFAGQDGYNYAVGGYGLLNIPIPDKESNSVILPMMGATATVPLFWKPSSAWFYPDFMEVSGGVLTLSRKLSYPNENDRASAFNTSLNLGWNLSTNLYFIGGVNSIFWKVVDNRDNVRETNHYILLNGGLGWRFSIKSILFDMSLRPQYSLSSKVSDIYISEDIDNINVQCRLNLFYHRSQGKETEPADRDDSDNDGILDHQDMAPELPEDKDGYRDADGIPDIDNDGDGLLDSEDQCPNQKGSKNNKGCPSE